MTIQDVIKDAESIIEMVGENQKDYYITLKKWLEHYKTFREIMSMYYNGKINKDKCFEMITDTFTENGRRKE